MTSGRVFEAKGEPARHGGERLFDPFGHEQMECSSWQLLIDFEEGGVIGCETSRHPLPVMHPDIRAGLIDAARRLDPMVLHWSE